MPYVIGPSEKSGGGVGVSAIKEVDVAVFVIVVGVINTISDSRVGSGIGRSVGTIVVVSSSPIASDISSKSFGPPIVTLI